MDADQAELTDRVYEYVRNNPLRGEDVELDDVIEWWRGLQELGPSLDSITMALEELFEKGEIEKIELGEGVFYYTVFKE